MPNQYTMNATLQIATEGTAHITSWLETFEIVERIENVENNPAFQEIDVDLIVYFANGNRHKIEIKVDRYDSTGNFFFETISNAERNTLGCFMYTQADRLFYYFIGIRKLYSLKMPEIREWFQINQNRFQEKPVQTPVGNGNRYTTVGKLVPIQVVLQECPEFIREFNI